MAPSIEELEQERTSAVVLANADGFIVYVNSAFEALFGWRAEEIVGRPLTTIIPKSLHDSHHLGFSRFLMTEQPTLLGRPLKLRAVTKDGHEFAARHLILAEKRDGKWIFGALIQRLGE